MKKILLIIIVFIISAAGCSSKESSDEENQKKVTEFSFRVSLFNAIEDLIEMVDKKEYIKLEEEMEELFLKSNQIGYVNNRQDDASMVYINNINSLAKLIDDAATKQKKAEIQFAAEKSMLSIISESNKEGGSGGSESEEGSGGDTNTGSSGDEEDSSNKIIIYDEELVKEYPEVTLNEEDFAVKDTIISLMDFSTKETLSLFPSNEKALINREKYLFYKIESLCRNDRYMAAALLIDELVINWQTLADSVENIDTTLSKTINTYMTNVENAIKNEDYAAIKVQCSGVIKELEKQISKPEEE